jgi:hypothetical protein
MNILYNKGRNRLTPERVNKILYIQINRRTLNRNLTFTIPETDEEDEQEQATIEEELERAAGHINEAEDEAMESGDEL